MIVQVLEDFIFNSHVIILLSGQFCLIFMLLFIVLSVGLYFFLFPFFPFPCFLPPPCVLFHSSIWDPLFLNGKFISVDGYERVPVFALCTEKNNAGRLRCPQHFLSSKTFLNPSFLIDACRKKKAHKLRWGMKAQKKVGRKKRPSRKGVLKKGL